MKMFNPPHPGILIKHQLVEDEEGVAIDSVDIVAKNLGIDKSYMEDLINCRPT